MILIVASTPRCGGAPGPHKGTGSSWLGFVATLSLPGEVRLEPLGQREGLTDDSATV